jgi:hypothetical protein
MPIPFEVDQLELVMLSINCEHHASHRISPALISSDEAAS